MRTISKKELKTILEKHCLWYQSNGNQGDRADLTEANLIGANLAGANLTEANLTGADLTMANLYGANLIRANLTEANLTGADLTRAYLTTADLTRANLTGANLFGANLFGADLTGANLTRADLSGAINLIKLMGVLPGNYYYKRFDNGLKNNEYQYFLGLNTLKSGETFAADERVMCSYPGFYFSSKSWCATNYSNRPLEALIKIPTNDEYPEIQINEPWTTDGKASANAIIIVQI